MKKGYFTRMECALWGASVALIAAVFFLFDGGSMMTLAASLIGVTSLIFSAKGNPVGQLLMVLFSLLYGVISYRARYYGEMITYLGMTMPMAVFALVAWLRHPYEGNRAQVRVAAMSRRDVYSMLGWTVAVTLAFFFILRALDTASLLPSTISVTTSFIAVYLTYRRSACFALAYAANDVVLIILWAIAAEKDPSAIAVLTCFAVFLVNDLYGFVSWRRMQRAQQS